MGARNISAVGPVAQQLERLSRGLAWVRIPAGPRMINILSPNLHQHLPSYMQRTKTGWCTLHSSTCLELNCNCHFHRSRIKSAYIAVQARHFWAVLTVREIMNSWNWLSHEIPCGWCCRPGWIDCPSTLSEQTLTLYIHYHSPWHTYLPTHRHLICNRLKCTRI